MVFIEQNGKSWHSPRRNSTVKNTEWIDPIPVGKLIVRTQIIVDGTDVNIKHKRENCPSPCMIL